MMPRDAGWHPGARFHRPLHHCAIGVCIRLKAHHRGIQINRSVCGSSLMFFDSGWWISTRRTPPGSSDTLIGVLMIFTFVPGDHAVERFDVVIAQANAAGADAHPDPKIRIRSVQKINPTVGRQANGMVPMGYPGQQAPRQAGRYLELYNGRECLPSGSVLD